MKCPNCGILNIHSTSVCLCGTVLKEEIVKKRKTIPAISSKRQTESYIYGLFREGFLIVNNKCAVKNCQCDSEEIHHMKGRIGFADAWAVLRNISLYLDIRFWLPVCANHHRWIEDHPEEAKKEGYSLTRLGNA